MSRSLDQQIRRHVTAAVEASPMAPDFASIADRGGSGGPPRRRPRVVTLLASAALVVVTAGAAAVVGVAVTRGSKGGDHTTGVTTHTRQRLPVVDVAATPKGWVPVDFGMAQISVPHDWNLYYEPPCFSGGQGPGWVLVGMVQGKPTPRPGVACLSGPVDPKAPHAAIEPDDAPGLPTRTHERRIVVNGITAYEHLGAVAAATTTPSLYFYIPRLGSELVVSRADAMRVLHTLTWSPRAVVLASGHPSPAPKTWKTVSTRLANVTLSFKVPPSWPTKDTAWPYGLCEPTPTWGLRRAKDSVTFSTDSTYLPVACSGTMGRSASSPPSNWLRVDENMTNRVALNLGLVFPVATSKNCFDVHRIRLCPATSPSGSVLFMKTRVTHLLGGVATVRQPVIISLGLGGTGLVARDILDSIRVHTASSSVG